MSAGRHWWLRAGMAARGRATRARREIHRVAAQGPRAARLKGYELARRVIGVQRSAQLPERLVRESAQSTLSREMPRPSDREWQAGYARAVAARVPGVVPEPDRDLEAGQ